MDLEYLNACDICRSDDIHPVDTDHHLYRCLRCGFIFDNPRPVYADILKFYSRETQYDSWISEETGRDALWKRRLDKIVRHKSSGALLDVGTGIGQFLHFAASRFDVSGTEISESAIDVAKKKYGLDVHRGELQEVDFGSRRFDAITLFHVLEHVPSPSLLIAKCAELLSGGGVLVIAVPNEIESLIKRPIKRLLSVLGIGKFASYGKFGLPKIELDGTLGEIHLSHFTAPVVRQLLRRQNFVVIDEGLDPYYSATGIKGMLHRLIYLLSAAIHTITHRNFYDAIWVVAKRG